MTKEKRNKLKKRYEELMSDDEWCDDAEKVIEVIGLAVELGLEKDDGKSDDSKIE